MRSRRDILVDRLDEFCKANSIKFLWAFERGADGYTTVLRFEKNNFSHNFRMSNEEIENAESIDFLMDKFVRRLTDELLG